VRVKGGELHFVAGLLFENIEIKRAKTKAKKRKNQRNILRQLLLLLLPWMLLLCMLLLYKLLLLLMASFESLAICRQQLFAG